MTRSRTPSGDVRAALVEAAVAVIEREGLAGLTVRAVAAEAGVAPMGVYNHLDGKDGMMVAVLANGFDGLRSAIAWPGDQPPLEAFLAVGRGYRAFALGRPVTYGLMFGSGTSQEVHARVADHADPAFGALLTVVSNAQAHGIVRAGPAELVAMTIWSAVHGAVSLELTSDSDPETGDQVYERVLEMVIRGLAPN